ncbi:uncharacterized protein LOC122085968 [Macadamia integrifolia]|uniref:uncharacterized protein LOC122085968 n=1 Tax=Macadamia integrifolia TaxID=60698 RepID=UPI001C4FE8D7|nr:uncharacterized protein LOC122085968 [Macadamia integrifolia]XP_042510527.1 uncharacterized protein LOC122085968 [Macadamia integrifolia]
MYAGIAAVLVVGFLGWVYQSTKPAPPRICGTPDGPPVTSPRIKLSDGRHLAYRESGVPKDEAKYRIIVIHGFDNSKEFSLPASQELIEELRIYFLSFDRAGYGDSDPNPKRSVKSEAFDIQELADQLDIGSKFYVIGASMGGYSVWGCLKYIPHRLAGVSLVSPVVNYWWPSLPANLSRNALREKSKPDQWLFRIAHYAPGLQYWLTTQKWLPSFPLFEGHPVIFSSKDKEILTKTPDTIRPGQDKVRQQGVFESLHRDMMIGFGTWDFDPMDLSNPFPQGEGSVYIWQGHEDRIVPCLLQRYVAHKLPWIRYHEVHDGGHLFIYDRSLCEAILRELFLGEEPSSILLD